MRTIDSTLDEWAKLIGRKPPSPPRNYDVVIEREDWYGETVFRPYVNLHVGKTLLGKVKKKRMSVRQAFIKIKPQNRGWFELTDDSYSVPAKSLVEAALAAEDAIADFFKTPFRDLDIKNPMFEP